MPQTYRCLKQPVAEGCVLPSYFKILALITTTLLDTSQYATLDSRPHLLTFLPLLTPEVKNIIDRSVNKAFLISD